MPKSHHGVHTWKGKAVFKLEGGHSSGSSLASVRMSEEGAKAKETELKKASPGRTGMRGFKLCKKWKPFNSTMRSQPEIMLNIKYPS